MSHYTHTYTIAFSLVSHHPSGSDVTADMLREALVRRIEELDASRYRPASSPDGEWLEAVGDPDDSCRDHIPPSPDDITRFAAAVDDAARDAVAHFYMVGLPEGGQLAEVLAELRAAISGVMRPWL